MFHCRCRNVHAGSCWVSPETPAVIFLPWRKPKAACKKWKYLLTPRAKKPVFGAALNLGNTSLLWISLMKETWHMYPRTVCHCASAVTEYAFLGVTLSHTANVSCIYTLFWLSDISYIKPSWMLMIRSFATHSYFPVYVGRVNAGGFRTPVKLKGWKLELVTGCSVHSQVFGGKSAKARRRHNGGLWRTHRPADSSTGPRSR